MSSPYPQVKIVGLSEMKAAALSLAQAFWDDDVAMYFVQTGEVGKWTPDEAFSLHLSIMECLVHAHILKGLVTTIGPSYDGVALW